MKLVVLILAAGILMPVHTLDAQTGYPSYSEMTQQLKSAVNRAPDIASIESIGKTGAGRDIWAITLSEGDPEQKAALLVVAGVDGTHLLGTELATRFVISMIDLSKSADSIKTLFKNFTIYVVPNASPDTRSGSKPTEERTVNLIPWDDDRDGKVDEDPADDLNNDGFITQMRIKTNGGKWMIGAKGSPVLVKADGANNETGQFDLLSEGFDNDGDGVINEDGTGGMNVNRSFAYKYRFFSEGAGPHPMYSVEARALADFCIGNENITAVMVYGLQDNLVSPWVYDKKEFEKEIPTSIAEEDASFFQFVSGRYKDITGFGVNPGNPHGQGSFADWAYFHFGRWAFAANGWEVPARQDSAEKDSEKLSRDVRLLQWLEENGSKVFIEWTSVKHPDFPGKSVEIGGFKPFARYNPPLDMVDSLSQKQNAFIAQIISLFPRLLVDQVKVEKLGEELFRVSVELVNTGYFPTNTRFGSKNGLCRNIRVALNFEDGKLTVTHGKRVTIVGPITGNRGVEKLEWVVSGTAKKFNINIDGPTIINQTTTINLK